MSAESTIATTSTPAPIRNARLIASVKPTLIGWASAGSMWARNEVLLSDPELPDDVEVSAVSWSGCALAAARKAAVPRASVKAELILSPTAE